MFKKKVELLSQVEVEDNLSRLKNQSFIDENDWDSDVLQAICQQTITNKNLTPKERYSIKPLNGRTLYTKFEQESTRTFLSSHTSFKLLGGVTEHINNNISQTKNGESYKDTFGVYGRYADILLIRMASQEKLKTYQNYFIGSDGCPKPIVNGMTRDKHCLQVLATATNLLEKFGRIHGLDVLYTGAWNNVARSFFCGLTRMGANVSIATPDFNQIDQRTLDEVKLYNDAYGSESRIVSNPNHAIKGKKLIYGDVWESMGEKKDPKETQRLYLPNRIDYKLVSKADDDCIVSHCMPIKGPEMTTKVKDHFFGNILDEAEYRKLTLETLFTNILRD